MTRWLFAAACVGLAGAVAAAVVLAVGTGGGGRPGPKPLTRGQYLSRVGAICRSFDRRLERIAPPANPANMQSLAQGIGQALPLIEQRTAAERAIAPPPGLKGPLARAFALTDEATRALETSRRKALAGDQAGAVRAFAQFIEARDQARQAASAIGLRC